MGVGGNSGGAGVGSSSSGSRHVDGVGGVRGINDDDNYATQMGMLMMIFWYTGSSGCGKKISRLDHQSMQDFC